jgi:DNA invertase Pin-like site-specific DNA recombinase
MTPKRKDAPVPENKAVSLEERAKDEHKPFLHKALEQLREGDVLVVWKLDRLSRSLSRG